MNPEDKINLILKTTVVSTMQITALVTFWGISNYWNYYDEYIFRFLGRDIVINTRIFYGIALAGSYTAFCSQCMKLYNIK
jgi:hypothetical protein